MSAFLLVVLIGFLHTLIPNHWLVTPTLVRSISLPLRKAFFLFLGAAFVHSFSTFILGFLSYFSAVVLKQVDYSGYVASFILLFLGVYYIVSGRRHHHHGEEGVEMQALNRRDFKKSYGVVLLTMFLNPSIEIVLGFMALGREMGRREFYFLVALYAVCYILFMTFLMTLAYVGILRMHFHFLERHFRHIVGGIFIFLAIFERWLDPILDDVITSVLLSAFSYF